MRLAMPVSPFGVSVVQDGSYRFTVTLVVEQMRRRAGKVYVGWATTPELDQVAKLGVVGDDGTVSGVVVWNKFLVLITEENSAEVESWQGPMILTGLAPAGRMHTMAGHGIFADIDCVVY